MALPVGLGHREQRERGTRGVGAQGGLVAGLAAGPCHWHWSGATRERYPPHSSVTGTAGGRGLRSPHAAPRRALLS